MFRRIRGRQQRVEDKYDRIVSPEKPELVSHRDPPHTGSQAWTGKAAHVTDIKQEERKSRAIILDFAKATRRKEIGINEFTYEKTWVNRTLFSNKCRVTHHCIDTDKIIDR